MKEIFKKLIGSLDNKKDSGFSGRKLTAFTLKVLKTNSNPEEEK